MILQPRREVVYIWEGRQYTKEQVQRTMQTNMVLWVDVTEMSDVVDRRLILSITPDWMAGAGMEYCGVVGEIGT
jgi:hypothetical protein